MAYQTPCEITDLFEYPQHLPLVAEWIYSEFWKDKDVHTPESLAELLRDATRPDEVPLSLLALVSAKPVATVNLVECDDDMRTHLRPWLAALLVLPEHRGHGIGSILVRQLQRRASQMGVDAVYLGTDIPQYYEQFGATLYEQVRDDFCIMRLDCSTG
jgi:predicted N-acetyltransferase YhbS